jgi:hypothetical protein
MSYGRLRFERMNDLYLCHTVTSDAVWLIFRRVSALFGAVFRECLSQLLNFSTRQMVSNSSPAACCGKAVCTDGTPLLSLHGGRLEDRSLKLRQHLSLQTHDFKVFTVHRSLYCRSFCAVVLRTALVCNTLFLFYGATTPVQSWPSQQYPSPPLRRSWTFPVHFVIFTFFRWFLTSSSHRDLGLPTGLV